MKLGWGWKIAILYGCFAILILSLVIASNRQHFDLVSDDYYGEEVAYQKVIDASKNQSALSQPLQIHANESSVIIEFPNEFKDKMLTGSIQFYSPVNESWDHTYKITPQNNSFSISRTELQKTRYILKINCTIDGKNYHQETEINLHA